MLPVPCLYPKMISATITQCEGFMRSRQQGKCSKIAAALTIIFTAGVLAGCATAPDSAHDRASPTGQHWVASWGTAQLVPEAANELPAASWRDASMRQIVHPVSYTHLTLPTSDLV